MPERAAAVGFGKFGIATAFIGLFSQLVSLHETPIVAQEFVQVRFLDQLFPWMKNVDYLSELVPYLEMLTVHQWTIILTYLIMVFGGFGVILVLSRFIKASTSILIVLAIILVIYLWMAGWLELGRELLPTPS